MPHVIGKRPLRLAVLATAVTLWVPAWASPPLNPSAGASTESLSRAVIVAQAGSMGGTVGKQDKSASGGEAQRPGSASQRKAASKQPKSASGGAEAQRTRSASQRPARDKQTETARITPEPPSKAAATRVNYDGEWRVSSSPRSGCATVSTDNVSVTGGVVQGRGLSGLGLSGHIGHGGRVNAIWRLAGWRRHYSGRVDSRSGSGVWKTHDGCTGTWTAVRV